MVGFGSSLRMGRRSGWEAAYLDYETLKLLLSQIESVYEEEDHQKSGSREDFLTLEAEDHRRKKNKQSNYRDELFLESDSDIAFASSPSTDDEDDEDDYEDGHKGGNSNDGNEMGLGTTGWDPELTGFGDPGTVQPFTIMGASFSDDSDETSGACVATPWSRSTKKDKNKKRRAKQKRRSSQDTSRNTLYYTPQSKPEPKSFILNEEHKPQYNSTGNFKTTSLLNAPFQYNSSVTPSESSTQVSLQNNNSALETFEDSPLLATFGKPNSYSSALETPQRTIPSTFYGSNVSAIAAGRSPATVKRSNKDWEKERRRQRRKRRLAKKKRLQGVPRHIQIAHSKSRSITERFLGLLRAEVEKVTLFAHARLGELADTAGSLRFLSSEELTDFSQTFVARPSSSAYEHPLSDGGIHPSASSSSDEAGNGKGIFPWSDSSSDEERSRVSNQFSLPQTFDHGQQRSMDMSIFGKIGAKRGEISKLEKDQYEQAKRKIGRFQELRMESPIFQRNDRIVGEDLLLVSAVDEADAYSAVGVELLHILKYICVNLIAVRKICRKHDYLLQNRMLGGYYHRKRTHRAQEEQTLGGLIAHVAGDINDAHPSLIGLVNDGKLIGVYDQKIQQLANSRTVKVICSCLALALSEYEVSRTRADALGNLNSVPNPSRASDTNQKFEQHGPFVSFDFNATEWVTSTTEKLASPCQPGEADSAFSDDGGLGPPSTTSSVSLARLRFTVLSISALREASRVKLDPFSTYLSRANLSFGGHAVVGEGLDGCSRETLDFLVSYTPDAALLLDSTLLHEGLVHGKWRTLSIAHAMRASLAVALRGGRSMDEEEHAIAVALSILPKSEGIDVSGPGQSKLQQLLTWFSISRFVDFPPALLRANRASLFLFTANYYIAHPMTNTFTIATGANVAYSAVIIGAPNISAIFSAIVHCNVLPPHSDEKQYARNFALYKGYLIVASLLAITGNIIHAHGIQSMSIPKAVLGRLVLGLASASVLHRQFLVVFLAPNLLVSESARLVQCQVLGMFFGLFVGSLLELEPLHAIPYGAQTLQTANWLMAFLWFVQFCSIVCLKKLRKNHKTLRLERADGSRGATGAMKVSSYDSDSSGSDEASEGPARLLHQLSEMRDNGDSARLDTSNKSAASKQALGAEAASPRAGRKRKVVTLMKRLKRIMAYNVAVPLALALVAYALYAQEVLFSSCALISNRYFSWRGNVAGFFLASLAILIMPVDVVCEQVARRYEERTTIKRGLLLLGLGLLVMTNWGSVFAMVTNLKVLFTERKETRRHFYDWLLGIPQYLIGFSLTFVAIRSLHSAAASLLSKVSPPNLRYIMVNLGTIGTVVGFGAQLLANVQIVTVGLSHRVINTDVVNALVVPLFVGCCIAYFYVRKHYFFLM